VLRQSLADIGNKDAATHVDRLPNVTGRRLNSRTAMDTITECEAALFKRLAARMKRAPVRKLLGIADPFRLGG